MTLFSHFAEARSRFGPAIRKAAAARTLHAAGPRPAVRAATLSQAELQREIIALIG